MTMADPETIIKWLKEAGAYAFQREDPEESLVIDLLVGGSTVGVRVTRGNRQEFKSLRWAQIERATLNPLTELIDDTIAKVP
jgi:hypothetical protein